MKEDAPAIIWPNADEIDRVEVGGVGPVYTMSANAVPMVLAGPWDVRVSSARSTVAVRVNAPNPGVAIGRALAFVTEMAKGK